MSTAKDKFPEHSAENLLKKDKAELERIKLAKEIHSYESRSVFERNKFWWETIRLVLIAVITSAVTLWANTQLEEVRADNALESKEQDEFRASVKKCREAIEAAQRRDCACELKEGPIPFEGALLESKRAELLAICEAEGQRVAEAQQVQADTSKEEVAGAKVVFDHVDSLNSALQNAQNDEQLRRLSVQLAEAMVDRDAMIEASPQLQRTVSTIGAVEQAVTRSTRSSIELQVRPESAHGAKSDVKWVKEGYFVQFGPYRVLLQYLGKDKRVQVQVCKTVLPGRCERPLANEAWVDLAHPLEFKDPETGKNFRVNLEAIDHAGKNPFTLAAYLTFEGLD